jgi:hypothetical protein
MCGTSRALWAVADWLVVVLLQGERGRSVSRCHGTMVWVGVSAFCTLFPGAQLRFCVLYILCWCGMAFLHSVHYSLVRYGAPAICTLWALIGVRSLDALGQKGRRNMCSMPIKVMVKFMS